MHEFDPETSSTSIVAQNTNEKLELPLMGSMVGTDSSFLQCLFDHKNGLYDVEDTSRGYPTIGKVMVLFNLPESFDI